MNVLVLACLLTAHQNPNPPDVDRPSGWSVKYFPNNDHSDGVLVGPGGQKIDFPAYGSAGDAAAELRGSDPESTFTHANIEDRAVDVCIARDGRLVVSYPRAFPPVHSSFAPFDYRTKVGNAHDAAIDLLILLTRIEAYHGKFENFMTSRPPEPALLDYHNWTGMPFGFMSIPLKYVFHRSEKRGSPTGSFDAPGKAKIDGFVPDSAGPPPLAQHLPPYRWEEVRQLAGREFHIAEAVSGGLVAWVVPSPDSAEKVPGPVFTAGETSARATVTLILMRLSFRGLQK